MPASAAKLQQSAQHQEDSGLFSSPEKRNAVVCLVLLVATLALYNAVNRNPFINCDDDRYVTENPYISSGLNWATVKWALTSTGQGGFWHPLTWISHALDIQLFHLNPAGHHFVSLLIHGFNAILIFLLLERATKRWMSAFVVSVLFAIHPMNVESVAWAAERKNVLSAFFFLATIAAYGWYALRPSLKRYLAVAGLFLCALASKPMAVTLPFALLLLDWWPLGRIGEGSQDSAIKAKPASVASLVVEKIPLLAMSLATSVVTMIAQRAAGATRSTEQFSAGVRLENAIVSYATYVWKMFWPANLTPVYPHQGNSLAVWQVGVGFAFLLSGSAAAVISKRRYLLVGWLWFLGILFPTIGLIQVGDQAMADRFAYVPELGILVMVVWGVSEIFEARNVSPAWAAIPLGAACLALAFVTHHQIAFWHSSRELWSHAISITKDNFIAEDNLGGALILEGREEEAHDHFLAAARINPRDPMSHSNLGTYLQVHGQNPAAAAEYESAAQLTSDAGLLAQIFANLAEVQRSQRQDDQARANFDRALKLNPNQFNAWAGLGLLAYEQGKFAEAIFDFQRSLELQPTAQAYYALGRAFAATQRIPEARDAYQQALRMAPDFADAQQALNALPQ